MKIKKIILISIFCILQNIKIFAAGMPVFDIESWIAAVDQLYSTYDMVQNMIQQVEYQYKQLQNAIEMAKTVDWNNIQWDGDFDIRDDIKSAGSRVNSLLTQTVRIHDLLTNPSITCGSVNYSIADLCFVGANGVDKNIGTAFIDSLNFATGSIMSAADNLINGLTDEQKSAIMYKYGISPRNYAFYAQGKTLFRQQCAKAINNVSDEVQKLKRETAASKSNAIISQVHATVDENGNPTQGAMIDGILIMIDQAGLKLDQLEESIENAADLYALKQIADEQREEAERQDSLERRQNLELMDSQVPQNFKVR